MRQFNQKGFSSFIVITPSDTVNIAYNSKPRATSGIMVGVAGNLACINDLGNAITLPVLAGVFYPIRTSRVNATNTTATGIVGLLEDPYPTTAASARTDY